jgi:hypothetical protein
MNIVLYGILFYFLWLFIFRFVIPVYRASKHIKKGFRDMHDRMSEQTNSQQTQGFRPQTTAEQPEQPKPSSKDYIDFEEVK